MSVKKRDRHNRWRNKSCNCMLSPEEAAEVNRYVALSGLTKQAYLSSRVLQREIKVYPNPRVYKALKNELEQISLAIEKAEANDETYELLQTVLEMIKDIKGEEKDD